MKKFILPLILIVFIGLLSVSRFTSKSLPTEEITVLGKNNIVDKIVESTRKYEPLEKIPSQKKEKTVIPFITLKESFRGSEELDSKIESLPNGHNKKTSLLKTSLKYPYILVEEIYLLNEYGEEITVKYNAMAADHIIVALNDNITDEKLHDLNSGNQGTVLKKIANKPLMIVKFEQFDINTVREKIAAYNSPLIKYAEPDYIQSTTAIPDDSSFSDLYALNNTGQTGGLNDADIDAPEAWTVTQGSQSVLVGVIDSGIDYNHLDLINNVWINPNEIPDNGIDDDNNGYIDDVRGWDFLNNDNDPMDDNSHGTHCAGTIGASGNNGIGVSGVCWNVSLLGLKFIDANGNGYTSDAVEAVYYATSVGVDITSNSWGGGASSQSLSDAITDAGNNNILFVAAAGNSSYLIDDPEVFDYYPAGYPHENIITVASTNSADQLSYYSNFGPIHVDIAAPGEDILSCGPGGTYRYSSGTSMATPHVAGVAALLKSQFTAMTALEIKDKILQTADPLVSLKGLCASEARLNAFNALDTNGRVSSIERQIDDISGNNDGILNPGETASLSLKAKNIGNSQLTGVTASLSTATPGITVLTGPVTFGDIESGQEKVAAGNIQFQIDETITSPTTIDFTLTYSDISANSWTENFKVNINDSGDFITKWVTTDTGISGYNQIKLPLIAEGTYNFTVDWGDGTQNTITSYNQPETTHTYALPGTYTVTVKGQIEGWGFIGSNDSNDRKKILEVSQWGNIKLNSESAFSNCSNMIVTAQDTLDTSSMTTARSMFSHCRRVTNIPNIENWDVSNITDMRWMLVGLHYFNQDISGWDVSNVTDMAWMLGYQIHFNQNIGLWDVSNVTDMDSMFLGNHRLSADLSNWNVSNVTNLFQAFNGVSGISGLENWDVSNVTNMSWTFVGTDMGLDLSNWDVSNVTNMSFMFYKAKGFTGLSNWDVSNVTNMSYMFGNAYGFSDDLSSWEISNVTNTSNMFRYNYNFGTDPSEWDVSNVSNMDNMFYGTAVPTYVYDRMLTGWSARNVQSGVNLHAGNSYFSDVSQENRQSLIDGHAWTISDNGLSTEPGNPSFIVTFNLGGQATRTGGGSLFQVVDYWSSAYAPEISVTEGWGFSHWDQNINTVTSNLDVNAVYAPLHQVTFDLAGKATRTGGGELVQDVLEGSAAIPPTLDVQAGWSFSYWDVDISNVTGDLYATAVYSPEPGNVGGQHQITNINELRWISDNPSTWGDDFIITTDLDLSASSGWYAGKGFSPIGTQATPFTGKIINGGGYVISNLTINRPDENYIGLFGYVINTDISDVILENVNITGNQHTGALAGYIYDNCTISNCSSSGSITGTLRTGGLIGYAYSNVSITNSKSSADINGYDGAGGFIGRLERGNIFNCSASGNVTGDDRVGGFVGTNFSNAVVDRSFSSGSVSGVTRTGGFSGYNDYQAGCTNSYSSGAVLNQGSTVGAFIGKESSVHHENLNNFYSLSGSGYDASSGVGNVPNHPEITGLDNSLRMEYGEINVDSNWQDIFFSKAFIDPVVIVGPPTRNEADYIVVRLKDINPLGFEIRLQEWEYLDQDHAVETLHYIVVERGRHTLSNGNELEAGTVQISGSAFSSQTFNQGFSTSPALLSSVATNNDSTAVTRRVKNVNSTGFQIRLQEQDTANQDHGLESVNYLAIEKGIFQFENKDLFVSTVSPVDERIKDVGITGYENFIASPQTYAGSDNGSLRMQGSPQTAVQLIFEEEQSKDDEVKHANETVAFIAVKEHVDVPEVEALMEIINVSIDSNWQTVNLSKAFTDPIVIAGPASSNEAEAVTIKIKNVSAASFEIKLKEFANQDGIHANENLTCMIVERGTYNLPGGTRLVADSIELSNSARVTVNLGSGMSSTPTVFASAVSDNDETAVVTRIRNITPSNFQIRLREAEANTQDHSTETVHYIALESGSLTTSGYEFYIDNLGAVNNNPSAINPADYTMFIAGQQTENGGDTAWVRRTGDINVFIEEEQTKDVEINHTTEIVGYMLIKDLAAPLSGGLTSSSINESNSSGLLLESSEIANNSDISSSNGDLDSYGTLSSERLNSSDSTKNSLTAISPYYAQVTLSNNTVLTFYFFKGEGSNEYLGENQLKMFYEDFTGVWPLEFMQDLSSMGLDVKFIYLYIEEYQGLLVL